MSCPTLMIFIILHFQNKISATFLVCTSYFSDLLLSLSGWKCERCKPDHYGEPLLYNCKSCECDSLGSISTQCDNTTGQCECKSKFTGRTCDRCKVSFFSLLHINITT